MHIQSLSVKMLAAVVILIEIRDALYTQFFKTVLLDETVASESDIHLGNCPVSKIFEDYTVATC